MEVRLSAHGAYQHQYHVVWIPKYRRRILRGAIKLFVQEQLPHIQQYHPDVEVQQWSVQIDHIHMVLVISPKYAVSSIVGKMKANVSRQLRLRYPELKRTYWGAVLWSPGFFSSTVGLNEAVIRRYVEHQEQMDKGQIQLEFEL
ncbi:MAG: IS200/IS605 family transposase [Nitrospirales bacterium]|nr:MAG: IS200/IS605 family transposase [Nitrospirales bacterium]